MTRSHVQVFRSLTAVTRNQVHQMDLTKNPMLRPPQPTLVRCERVRCVLCPEAGSCLAALCRTPRSPRAQLEEEVRLTAH